MTRPHTGAQNPDTTVLHWQVKISELLHELLDWLPLVEVLTLAAQRMPVVQTPEAQAAIAALEAHERDRDHADRQQYAGAGRQWMRPEQRLVGGGHTRTPAATLGALSLLNEITRTLHEIIRYIVTEVTRAGLCLLRRVDANPTTRQLIEHVREFAWDAPSVTVLTRVHAGIASLNDQANLLVDGDAQTTIPRPCPHCHLMTLRAYFRDDVIVCGTEVRGRHLQPCICPDPFCDCKGDPISYRHRWYRAPSDGDQFTAGTTGPTKERNTWRHLDGLLDDNQPPTKETTR